MEKSLDTLDKRAKQLSEVEGSPNGGSATAGGRNDFGCLNVSH